MTDSSINYVVDDGVAILTLAQGARGNPFDGKFCAELNAIATQCSINRDIRSILIRAEGRFFSVGGDLNSLASSREGLANFVSTGTANLHMAISRLARCDAPVIAAVHALAAGGAVAFLAGADFVLASPEAAFYAAFTGIGISCDTGGSYFLPRRVGSRKAAAFLLLNQTWSAEEAMASGLVTQIVPRDDLDAEALKLARKLAAGPTRAYGEIKNLLLSSFEQSLEGQLEIEARAMARSSATDDAWQALNAVKAKQKPTFNNI
jgi:2-(1,2-epoxy-1,2-dihydrophenyl)acetyl-CoA isomerase